MQNEGHLSPAVNAVYDALAVPEARVPPRPTPRRCLRRPARWLLCRLPIFLSFSPSCWSALPMSGGVATWTGFVPSASNAGGAGPATPDVIVEEEPVLVG